MARLIMDEATANVDMASDELIQLALRRDFHDATIITIAHRINTVIDYDRILVLEQGEIAEYDTPWALLQREGYFSKMVDGTGAKNATLLRKLAEEKHEGRQLTVDALLQVDKESTSE